MKRLQKISLGLLITLLITACGASNSESALKYEEVFFAHQNLETNQLDVVANNTFQGGDLISMVAKNVGPFTEGEDGLHWIDMDSSLKDPNGTIVYEQKNQIGEQGKTYFPDGIALNPLTYFQTDTDLAPGKYSATMVIHDRVSGEQVSIERDFTLEQEDAS